jgi:hypothetical protein
MKSTATRVVWFTSAATTGVLLSPARGVLVPKEGLELALNLNRHRASRPLQISAHVLLQPRQQLSLHAHLIKTTTT